VWLAAQIAALDNVIAALRSTRDDLAEKLAKAMPRDVVELAGVGRVERRRGKDRKAWDHDALFARVLAYGRDERRVDLETGEVLESEGEAVLRVLREMAHVDYWKAAALRQRRLNPDEFATATPGRASIQVNPSKEVAT
jgi:hypothetical protein